VQKENGFCAMAPGKFFRISIHPIKQESGYDWPGFLTFALICPKVPAQLDRVQVLLIGSVNKCLHSHLACLGVFSPVLHDCFQQFIHCNVSSIR